MPGHTPEAILTRVGTEVGVSDWLLVDQTMIDRFAELTGDRQFIHVDPVRAAYTPFGGTIAHGFLVLSLLGGMVMVVDIAMAGATMGVNYGFDRIRFVAPVRSGRRIRGRFTLRSMEERSPGRWMSTIDATVEIEGETKPALTAQWVTLTFVSVQGGHQS